MRCTPNCSRNLSLGQFAQRPSARGLQKRCSRSTIAMTLSPEEEALAELLKHKDIWPVLGNKGAATEVLSGRRSISKTQARRLAEFFHVPIDPFV